MSQTVLRLLLAGFLTVGALSSMVERGTVARFTSAAASTPNQFSAGTLDLASSPAAALLTLSTMVPGDTLTAPLTLTNSGDFALTYALASTVTDPDGKGLGGQLTLRIRAGVAACTTAGFDSSGTDVYGTPASPLPLGTIGSSRNLIGDPTARPNGGRTLAQSASETLCFQVALPASSGAQYVGAATTATFQLLAE